MSGEGLFPDRVCLRQGSRLPALSLTVALGCAEEFDGAEYTDLQLLVFGPRNLTLPLTWDATAGVLTYAWADGDTDVPGVYVGIVEGQHTASAAPRRIPCHGGLQITIEPMPG